MGKVGRKLRTREFVQARSLEQAIFVPDPNVSRQRNWQIKQKLLGRCVKCGGLREPDLETLCRKCQDDRNAKNRAKRGGD